MQCNRETHKLTTLQCGKEVCWPTAYQRQWELTEELILEMACEGAVILSMSLVLEEKWSFPYIKFE